MRFGRTHERGAAMVEMAIVLPIFLALVFAIIEFSMVLFNWSRVIETSRAGVRYAIVNNVECADVTGDDGMVCPGASPITCTLQADSKLLEEMQKTVLPGMLMEDSVNITYACSDAGSDERPTPILQVSVEITGMQHQFIVSGLFGVDLTMTLPDQATTRTSEDLYTTPEE